MREELVSVSTAELAKEKGFDYPCIAIYMLERNNELSYASGERILNFGGWTSHAYKEGQYPSLLAPTQSLLAKWLREVHNIHIEIKHGYGGYSSAKLTKPTIWFQQEVYSDLCEEETDDKTKYNKYEEALEAGLKEALNLIK